MKILIISPGYFPITGNYGGAIENLINIYLKYNDTKEDKITVYSVEKKGYEIDKNIYKNTEFRSINISSFTFKIQNRLYRYLYKFNLSVLKRYYIKAVIKDLKRRKELDEYDLIIFENGQDFVEYFNKKVKTKARKVLHLHNDYLNVRTKRAKEKLNSLNEVWCVSNFIKRQVLEIDKKRGKDIKVLYNCINFPNYNTSFTSDERIIIRQELNITEKDFVFLYVGRIMPEKGVKELVEAFLKLNRNYDNIKLLVVGGGRGLDNTDKYIESVYQKSNKNIIFVGQVRNDNIYKYYLAADVQIVPSIWEEAFGLILLEGISFKLPIICTLSGGMPEVMGNCCLYVNRDNLVDELFVQMKKLYREPSISKKFISNYSKISEKFSVNNYENSFYNYVHIIK